MFGDIREAVKEMKLKKRRFLIMADSLPEGEVKRLAMYLNKDDLPGMEFDCMEQFRDCSGAIASVVLSSSVSGIKQVGSFSN